MTAEIIQFVPRANHNKALIDRCLGIPPTPGTAETDADPRNPNVDTTPSEYIAPADDCA